MAETLFLHVMTTVVVMVIVFLLMMMSMVVVMVVTVIMVEYRRRGTTATGNDRAAEFRTQYIVDAELERSFGRAVQPAARRSGPSRPVAIIVVVVARRRRRITTTVVVVVVVVAIPPATKFRLAASVRLQTIADHHGDGVLLPRALPTP